MDNGDSKKGKSFGRPWEDEGSDAEVFTLPGLGLDPGEAADGVDLEDWDAMAAEPSELDEFTSLEYSSATTEEYRGLAEDVSRAAAEQWELQAVAATVPGVDTGLVGFEDVTGTVLDPEETYEASEQAASSDMTMRIASALIVFGMFVGSLLLGGWWFAGFIGLVMVVATGEFYSTVRTRGYSPIALFGLLAVLLMAVSAETSGASAIAGWAGGFAGLTVLFFSLSSRRKAVENAAVTVAGFAWVGLLSFAILIARGPSPVANIMFVVLLVAMNDSGAFFVGRSFGRRRLSPKISPNKTLEGLLGGAAISFATAAVLSTFPAWEAIGFNRAMAVALVVSIFSPIGDAIESMVKRSLGVKDMGSVLPGHGGILDRIDSFILVIPAVYLLFRGFGLL